MAAGAVTENPARLYHFTCDHGYRKIGRYNALLIPQGGLHPVAGWPPLLWFTTLSRPDRESTGLGNVLTTCNRMAHRYEITDLTHCQPWLGCFWRQKTPPVFLETLESYGDPEHWWVSDAVVPARWDQIWALTHQA